ncbi:C40 family peptidase [Streptomyces specialis]|uniref:C40 family peptidase n=1 Tax=Streptomyces specialis TaxID=498367 RepID=UPI00073E1583|nr:C40 family peptidase [Streptomyces specialis]
MRKTVGLIAGLISAALLLALLLLIAVTGRASAACAGGIAGAVDAEAVAAQVAAVLEGADATSVAVPGLDDPAEQVPHALTIQATGVAMRVPARGQVVALATALQESDLRNLDHGDRDSLGLFQQRPSQGWGTADQIMRPEYASAKFYEALRQVPGWESMTVAQAAQAVQRSGVPDAYARWEPLAKALQAAIEPRLTETEGSEDPFLGGVGGCAAGALDAGFGTIPAGSLPADYSIPADASPQARTAIRWALGQLGTPYQWGGSCTDPRGPDPMGRCDCSSLIQQAYKAAGVTLSRTTYTQVKEGKPVSATALRPGDLLFTRGTAEAPEHVGMFIGQDLVVHAPETGDVVRVAPLASWQRQIVAARRVA